MDAHGIPLRTLVTEATRAEEKMLVKLLKMQDFYDFTLCSNAMHSTWLELIPLIKTAHFAVFKVCGNISTLPYPNLYP